MVMWEDAVVKAVKEQQCVNEDAVEAAAHIMNYSPAERAHVVLEGPLMAVRHVQASWIKRLASYGVDEGQDTYDQVMGMVETYLDDLIKDKDVVFAFHAYLVMDHVDVAAEHVWCFAHRVWSMVAPDDVGVTFYSKRAVLAYAYGQTLRWWYAHQDEDFCALMHQMHTYARQGVRAGRMAKQGLKHVLSMAQSFSMDAHNKDK